MLPESEQLLTSGAEHAKLDVDILKHLTTLSTGAIVVLATFMDKLAPARHVRIAIPMAIVCFLLCILYAVKGMMLAWVSSGLLLQIRTAFAPGNEEQRAQQTEQVLQVSRKLPLPSKVAFQIVQYSFTLGIASVGLFVVCNFELSY